MKITVVAGFSAKRNMNVNACHAAKLLQYKFFTITIALLLVLKMNAQVSIVYKTEMNQPLIHDLKLDSVFTNKSEAEYYIDHLPNILRAKGFIYSSIDTVKFAKDFFEVHLYLGQRYTWKALRVIGDEDVQRYSESFLAKPNEDASQLLETIANRYADKGYPFAQIRIDSIEIHGENATGLISINKGNVVRIDSLKIIGKRTVNNKFLQNYLNIHNNDVYRKKLLEETDEKINRLSFLETERPSAIEFFQTGSVINLYLKNKAANRINAVIGFMQQNNVESNLLITGDIQLLLQNSFSEGETIELNWQQLQARSPRLHLSFQQLYLGRSKWGIHFAFDLFKKDSAFVNVMLNAGVSKQLNNNSALNFYVNSFSGSLSNIDTGRIKYSKQLPAEADLTIFNVGLGYDLDKRNSVENSTQGIYVKSEIEIGSKKIKKNNTVLSIKETGYQNIYDTIKLTSYNAKISVLVENYYKLSPYSVIKVGLNAASLVSDKYYLNEMYRIGGINVLRGFDEQSIFSKRYAVATVEYRYLFNRNSFFRLFSDVAAAEVSKIYNYASVGTGITLSSKAGQLNLLYAAGKRNDESFNFKRGKVHIGFSALF